MPHLTVANLRACFKSLEANQAIGVDGVTKTMYGQNVAVNLQRRYPRRHQMSYRPQPVRRVERPKADGSTRPLGISGVEDNIVQEMARRILEAIDEPLFIDPSYGFRPGRSGPDTRRQLHHEVMSEPVNWIADMDMAKFFDTMPHSESLAVLSERLADQQFLRLIVRMLKAGVQTPGKAGHDILYTSSDLSRLDFLSSRAIMSTANSMPGCGGLAHPIMSPTGFLKASCTPPKVHHASGVASQGSLH
jgi:RNA-directed DNA polymerase